MLQLIDHGDMHALNPIKRWAGAGLALVFVGIGARRVNTPARVSGDPWATVCWEVDLHAAVRSTPAVTSGSVYIGTSDGHLYALDRRAGSLRWRFDARSPVDGSPAVLGPLVFATARNGTLYAVGASDGRLRWQHTGHTRIPLRPPLGNLDYMIASPIVVDSTIYLGGADGHVYALAANTGAEHWHVDLQASIWTEPAIADRTVYIAANDGRLYALDRRTGARRWRFETEGSHMDLEKEGYDRRSIQSTPSIADGIVIFGSRDGNVYGVDVSSGHQRWRATYAPSWVSASPTIHRDTVFVTTSDAKVVAALDLHT